MKNFLISLGTSLAVTGAAVYYFYPAANRGPMGMPGAPGMPGRDGFCTCPPVRPHAVAGIVPESDLQAAKKARRGKA